jgi:hypothetical protein
MAFVNNCALIPPIQSPVIIATASWPNPGWPPSVAAAPLPFSPAVVNPIYPPLPVPPLVPSGPFLQDIYGYQGPPYECCKPRYNNWPYDHFSTCDPIYNNCCGFENRCINSCQGFSPNRGTCKGNHRDARENQNKNHNRNLQERNQHNKKSCSSKGCQLCQHATKRESHKKEDKLEALLRSFGKSVPSKSRVELQKVSRGSRQPTIVRGKSKR